MALTIRRLLTLAIIALVTPVHTAVAGTGPEGAAQTLVRDTTDRVRERLRQEGDVLKDDPARLNDLVYQMILPHFDFALMSQRVLGKHWRGASADQRARFVDEFQTMLVRTYASALIQYRDNDIEFLTPREYSNERVRVRTQVVLSAGPPLPINYDLYDKKGEWTVYDVAIGGISLVMNYRATFSSEVGKVGIEGLIDRLSQFNKTKASDT